MQQKLVRLVGVAAAAVVSAGVFTMVTGQASAAVNCSAPRGQACVAVTNKYSAVRSIRVNGRCLVDTVPGQTRYHADVRVSRTQAQPDVQTYGGRRCEGGTHNSAGVKWNSSTRADGFRVVTISERRLPGCGSPVQDADLAIIC
jgi:hypothetical protein